MADTWSPIGAARHLVFPCHRLIQTPTRRCALTPLGCTALPRVIARSRDTQDLGHQGDRVGSPWARPSAQSAGVVVQGGEEGAGFSQELILLLQLAHPPAQCRDLSFQLAWIRTTLFGGLAPLALEFDPAAHHRFTQPSIPGHRRDSWTPYPTPETQHHDDTPAYNDDENPYQAPHWPQAHTPASRSVNNTSLSPDPPSQTESWRP